MTDEKEIMYVVTSGEYSDYCINGVFSSEELAKAYIKEKGGHIEMYYLNDDAMPLIEYRIEVIDKGGNVLYNVEDSRGTYSKDYHGCYWDTRDSYYFYVTLPVSKANADVALKIVQDWYMQIKALNLRLRDWGIVTEGKVM